MIAPLIAAAIASRLASVPVMDWLLWLGSVALSIALVFVLRTQWGQSRPLQKCAVLSLLVHALLACLAMTIRVVVGDGGGGGGAPIRVRLVDASDEGISVAHIPAEAPSIFMAPTERSDPPALEPDSTNADVVESAERTSPEEEAPQLLAPPTSVADQPAETQQPNVDETADPVDSEMVAEFDAATATPPDEPTPPRGTADVATTESASNLESSTPRDVSDEVTQPTEEQSTALPTHASAPNERAEAQSAIVPGTVVSRGPAPAASEPYALRGAPGRLGLVQMQGGNAQTEAAVAAALAWLAGAQSDDGRWDATRFGAGHEQNVLGHDRGGAGRNADTGISALALLALLGAGHSHQQGDYQDTVRRGLEFLIRSQEVDGSLFGQSTFYAQMYCHSMATFALAEAQAMTGDARLEPVVYKAIGFSVRAQNPATGGWRYRPTYDTGDTSQLGWQMMALASARQAGAEVPAHTWARVERFLKSVRRGNYGGLASYRPDSPATTSMTAEALYCTLMLHDVDGGVLQDQAAVEATNQLLASLPNAGRVNLYYWYYATLALHKRQQAGEQAAAAWQQWNDALTTALLKTQVAGGPNAGSWNTNSMWGGYGGRVYTTAMAAMCLEVYYRYAPSQVPQSIATPREPGDRPR